MSFGFLKNRLTSHVITYTEKPARESHDAELAWRDRWIANPNMTSYFWYAERGGATLLQEYDACSCSPSDVDVHPRAHLHALSELPGVPKPIVVDTVHECTDPTCGEVAQKGGLVDRADHAHVAAERPVIVNVHAFSEPFEAFTLRAFAAEADGQSLPTDIAITCDPATTRAIIWAHRTFREDGMREETQLVKNNVPQVNADGTPIIVKLHHADSLVYGRVLTDGTQEVYQVYADGARFEHASYEDAHAHEYGALHGPAVLGTEYQREVVAR
jgi:hypothetical protein